MRFVLAAALVLAMAPPVFAIDSDKLPFGSQVLRTYTTQEVQKLSEEMCFNYFIEYDTIGPAAIDMLYEEGIQTIKGGIYGSLTDAEPPMKYSWSNYAVIDVDYPYPNEDVWMKKFGGSFANGCWISNEESIDTLSGISTYQEHFLPSPPNPPGNRVGFFDRYFFNFFNQVKIHYRVDIKAAIDNPDSTSDEIVATVTALVGMWHTCEMKPIYVDTILVRDFGSSSSLQWILGEYDLVIPDSFTVVDYLNGNCVDTNFYTNEDQYGVNKRWNPYLRLDIVTTGAREFKVDLIKISDEIGRNLIDLEQYDQDITETFEDQQYLSRAEKIYAWMLMDEPLFTNIMPFQHIDALMHEVYDDWLTFTNFWQYSGGARLIHTYLSMVDVDYVAPDIYPYGTSDVYAGDSFQDLDNGVYGPLWRFPRHVGWVRKSVDEIDKEFWITVQAFEGYGDNPIWRYPTASELSVQVYISLAWGCRGIQVWLYDPYRDDFRAIRDPEGGETRLYAEIRDHIGPYLQAVDSIYLPLTWDRCYTYKPDHEYDQPEGAYIDAISTYTHPDTANPDTGWYQIGEFHDDTAKYIMLVNRACSQGETSQNPENPAPSVTATVRFDPSYLGLGNYVYIIDLADSLRLAGADTGWVGIPDTTYSANLGGTIPFTTVLGPGEGRLFKIVGTVQQ